MSIKTVSWVWDHAPVKDTALIVLLALADYADNEGRHAFPSQATLAQRARCTDRQVRRALVTLREQGLIVEGDQQHVAHYRPDRRPVVYDLVMSRGDILSPRGVDGGTLVTERPDIETVYDRTPMSDKPTTEPTTEPKTLSLPDATESARDEVPGVEFEEFWREYPRQVGKAAARVTYTKHVQGGADPAAILRATIRHAEDMRREDRPINFVPHPTTWLNRTPWEDEDPEPPPVTRVTPEPNEFDLVERWTGWQRQVADYSDALTIARDYIRGQRIFGAPVTHEGFASRRQQLSDEGEL